MSGSSSLVSASAGEPMLTVLNHSGPGEVYSAVIRYFGRIKLGKGGLIRAYTGSVQQPLALLDTAAVQPMLHFRLDLDYNLLALLESLLEQSGTHIVEPSFAEGVGLDLLIPKSGLDQLQKQIARISGGALRLEPQNDP
jgi:putative IMPACT (imprinted ancient) family translation regulator